MKATSFLCAIMCILLCNAVVAQDINYDEKLPNDTSVLYGVLPNGLTYYIRSNALPANRAELTLAVRAGSVLEDDDQQGLAHFTEHMAFNGSRDFPKQELVKYLESLGMQFGPEVNAYTSFDETVFGIKVPTESEEYIDKGLLVLYNWASQLSFDPEEIKAESGVIHEEWRMGQGAIDRLQRKVMKTVLNGSKYAERLPIGLMEIVDNCKPEVIKRFYHDWYRPDLMAVIVVGDFDKHMVEQKVKTLFGDLVSPANPRPRTYEKIPAHTRPTACAAADPEMPMSILQIYYLHEGMPRETVGDTRNLLISSLMSQMLGERLQEITLAENAPFVQAYSAYASFIAGQDVYMSIAMMQNNDVKTTLNAIVAENLRMAQHGFTETELERQKSQLMKEIETAYNERDKQKSESYVELYKRNFLPPSAAYPDMVYTYDLYKKLLPTITLADVNAFAKTVTANSSPVLVFLTPEKAGETIISDDELLQTYQQATAQSVEPYVDKVVDSPLVTNLPPKGKVAKVKKFKDLDYQVWTLKNGIKIYLKSTDFKDDEILFYAKSFGGSSLYDEKDNISCRVACDVAEESGMGDFDKVDLEKFMSGKEADVSPFLGELTEGLSGYCAVDDVETLLQMIYSSFTKPKVTETAFNSFVNKNKGLLEQAKLDPQTAWQDTMSLVMGNYNKRRLPMSPELLDNATYKRVRYIFNQRFGDPTNFVFYFVGNIDFKAIKPLIEKYLGALPVVDRRETFKDHGIRPPQGVVEKVVYKGKDPKCLEIINFHGNFDFSAANYIRLNAVCKVLSTRLLEQIREKESGVYTIGAFPNCDAYPQPHYAVSLFYSCDPDREPELVGKIFDVVKSLQTTDIADDELAKVIEKLKREHESSVKENEYWKNELVYINEGLLTPDDILNYVQTVTDNISKANLKADAQKYFDFKNYVKVQLRPEK